ncbi:hypothetical protein KSS87_010802 [Heliosperma pusillum]|nr:hypothetical protein KSS87_010802 [Heliosperma pusillum]
MPKNFRKRRIDDVETAGNNASDDEETSQSSTVIAKIGDKGVVDGDKEELVLQDTFAQETAVMVEDPNIYCLLMTVLEQEFSEMLSELDPQFDRLKFIEQELAKKRGKNDDTTEQAKNTFTDAEDELYKIPEHLKVTKKNSEESSTQWTTGIAEIQLPIEYKLKNIEETEAAKKLLHEKRLTGRSKTESGSSYSHNADYFQRGKDYAEKLRREHPELFKDGGVEDNGVGSRPGDNPGDPSGRRLAATDELMLSRFRKRERQRVMRR